MRIFGKKAPPPNASGSAPRGLRKPERAAAAAGSADGNGVDRVFSAELFEGESGAFLRQMGYAPDDPRNIVGQRDSLKSRLEEDYIQLQEAAASVNRACATPVAPFFLLPPPLWETRHGRFLIEMLDMSPYRPWNATFLPVSRGGGLLKELPLHDSVQQTAMTPQLEQLVDLVIDVFQGVDDPPARAFRMMFESVRENHPDLFPPEQRDLSPPIVQARADLRTLAISQAGIDVHTIRKCHSAFLAQPELQLLN